MNELQLAFDYEALPVRTITDGIAVWFVGKDVATALGHQNPERAIRKFVDEEDKGVTELVTPGGKQSVSIINESGVYALIFASQTEYAKKFKYWVTHEVLPTIRKQGYYSLLSDEELLDIIIEKQRRNREFLTKIDKTAIKSLILKEERDNRDEATRLLFLRQREISCRQFRAELKAIWKDDMPRFHKYLDEYQKWYNKVGCRIAPFE